MVSYKNLFPNGEDCPVYEFEDEAKPWLKELTEGFVSEIAPFNNEMYKWEKYEECKRILGRFVAPGSSEYNLAITAVIDKLNI